MVTLAGVAAVTGTIRLGTSVCLVVARDPIVLAKQDRITELRERAAETGRSRPSVTLVYARPDCLEEYAAMGVDHCVFDVDPQASTGDATARIEAVGRVTDTWRERASAR